MVPSVYPTTNPDGISIELAIFPQYTPIDRQTDRTNMEIDQYQQAAYAICVTLRKNVTSHYDAVQTDRQTVRERERRRET